MDLYPWLCALYIEGGHRYAILLMERAQLDAKKGGFPSIYLCTNHTELYEKYGYEYIGSGFHPWGESSRIYKKSV